MTTSRHYSCFWLFYQKQNLCKRLQKQFDELQFRKVPFILHDLISRDFFINREEIHKDRKILKISLKSSGQASFAECILCEFIPSTRPSLPRICFWNCLPLSDSDTKKLEINHPICPNKDHENGRKLFLRAWSPSIENPGLFNILI